MKKRVAALLRKLADKLSREDNRPERSVQREPSDTLTLVRGEISLSEELFLYNSEEVALKHAKEVLAEDIKERLMVEGLINFNTERRKEKAKIVITGYLYVLIRNMKRLELQTRITPITRESTSFINH